MNSRELKRYPVRKDETLQAWDSADELMIQHTETLVLANQRLLIVNDQFGALSAHLMNNDVTVLTDSFVSSQGISLNTKGKVVAVNSFDQLNGKYDLVLIQMPKNLSYFEDLLCRVSHHLHQGSKIVCGVMLKHLAPSSFDLLQKYIGPTTTSLAQKKARLIFTQFEKTKVPSPYPIQVKLDGMEKEFTNHSNLFSREKLDIGTRFFLDHLPQGNFHRILDLGCANGVVGIKAKLLMPDSQLVFTDDSAMAIESAKSNYQKYFQDKAKFFWTNCFENGEENSLDLVLCNPPFHQSHTLGDFIAWQMFQDAQHALKPGGFLRVIGNSHLGYQVKLKKLFGNSKIVATNTKFMIIDSYK